MKKYIITLTDDERAYLSGVVSAGKAAARKQTRARILLKADSSPAGPAWTDAAISAALEVDVQTVANVRRAFVEEGFEIAWQGQSTRNHRTRKIDGECEAHLIALLCQAPPAGHAYWALRLLADQMVKLDYIDTVSHETVRQALLANDLKPWQEEEWCIPPEQSGAFVCQMEEVLELYTLPEDPRHPLVCMDELSKQLVSEMRVPLPIEPGHPRRYDYEYRREGVCNVFMLFAPLLGQRWVTVTAQRTYQDWAYLMRDLVDQCFPDAEFIRVVQDNLNTHIGGALYETFEPAEAKRILDKLEFHYTPKHGSWLNMAEIELRVLNGQCLNRRMGDIDLVKREAAAWETERNTNEATVNWRFTTADARIKLKRLYPVTQPEPLTQRPTSKLGAGEAALRARRRADKKAKTKKHKLHSQGK